MVRLSRLVESLLAISSSLRFAAACHTGAYFPLIVSLQSGVQSRRSFTVYDIRSRILSLTFRVVITSQFDVQSHHHHFSVSAFRAIIGFQIDIQSHILVFGVQSRYHFSASVFRAIIITSQFRRSEPSLLSISVQSHPRRIFDFGV